MSLKSLIYKTALNGFYYTGLHTALAPMMRGQGLVLTLHHVRPLNEKKFRPNDMLEITPAFFDELLGWLRDDGYELVSLADVHERLLNPSDQRFAAITFDDGYRDNLEYAYPILQRHGAPFTIFITTGFMDRSSELWWIALERLIEQQQVIAFGPKGDRQYLNCRSQSEKHETFNFLRGYLLMSPDAKTARTALRDMCWRYEIDLKALCEELIMDWPTLRQVAQDPLMTVGAHTIDHHNLAVVDKELLEAEVSASAKLLEAALGEKPRFFAYPYGFGQAVNQAAVAAVRRAGYDAAFTTMPDTLNPGYVDQMAALPRVSVNGLYQRLKYIDVLTSGVAFKLKNRGQKIAIPA